MCKKNFLFIILLLFFIRSIATQAVEYRCTKDDLHYFYHSSILDSCAVIDKGSFRLQVNCKKADGLDDITSNLSCQTLKKYREQGRYIINDNGHVVSTIECTVDDYNYMVHARTICSGSVRVQYSKNHHNLSVACGNNMLSHNWSRNYPCYEVKQMRFKKHVPH